MTGDLPRDVKAAAATRPLTVRVPEACRLTGIGRSKLYELIKERRIRTVKVGAITLIPLSSLTSFLGLDEASADLGVTERG
jgi:excisionase family DNA binding protein